MPTISRAAWSPDLGFAERVDREVLAITGQNVRAQLGKEAFQCVDIATIARPVCKAAWCITEPAQVPPIMRRAFQAAREGRPGPVLIDLPKDVLLQGLEQCLV